MTLEAGSADRQSAELTRSQRAADRLVRWTFVSFGLPMFIVGTAAAIGQGNVGAALFSLIGAVMLTFWWLRRPPSRFTSAPMRRCRRWCVALNIGVGALSAVSLVALSRSPAYDPSVSTLMPAIVPAAAAIVLLFARVLVGRRLRGYGSGSGSAGLGLVAGGGARAGAAQRDALDERQGVATVPRVGRNQREIAELRDRLRRGEYPSTSSLEMNDRGRTAVMRPDRGRLGRWYRGPMLGALPFAVVMGVRAVASGEAGTLALGMAVVLGAPVGVVLYELRLRRGVTRLTETAISVRSWYGRQHCVARGLVRQVVLVSAELGSMQSYVVPLLLFVGEDGRCLLHVNAAGVPGQDQKAFAAALDVPVDIREQRLGPEDLRQEFPGSLSWYAAHQVLIGVLTAIAITLVVIGAVVALGVTGAIPK